MPTEKKIEAWSKAFDHLMLAREHLRAHRGKPGENAARLDHEKALEAYTVASQELDEPDA